MPYRYLEDIATADVAFEAWGRTEVEMFIASADAVMNVMVADLSTVAPEVSLEFTLKDESLEMLLFQFLQELIYFKDADQLLLKTSQLTIQKNGQSLELEAAVIGETLNPKKHELIVDVKAVTLHLYTVKKTPKGWQANIILDV